jgi:peptidoglycan/xylan/chitin deacetylase (PgdA/CDA1 family)
MYHSVSSIAQGAMRDLAVPAETLTLQLSALVRAGYRLTGLTEALQLAATGAGQRVVALTFDDGYLDFLQLGMPILQDVGATATLYVPTSHVGQKATWLGADSSSVSRLMTWTELGDAAAEHIEIGSHGFVHHPVDVLPPAVLADELSRSRAELEQRLGVAVSSFCYPHGYTSRAVVRAVSRAGYANACVVGRRLHRLDHGSFEVDRLHITPAHSAEQVLDVVRTAGPNLLPAIKDALRPSWRVTRRVVQATTGRTLT